MARLEAISNALNRWLSWIGGGVLVAMMLVTVGNLIMVQFKVPFTGAAEIVRFLAAVVAAFALGYTQINRGHVAIDIFVVRLPQRAQAIIDSIMFFIIMALFGVATWQVVELASRYWELGSVSETLYIIFFPFIYAVALGCTLLCLVLLLDFLKSLAQAVKR
jgi:TRAP-type C4-dicarboxylate transport system permease small subunit